MLSLQLQLCLVRRKIPGSSNRCIRRIRKSHHWFSLGTGHLTSDTYIQSLLSEVGLPGPAGWWPWAAFFSWSRLRNRVCGFDAKRLSAKLYAIKHCDISAKYAISDLNGEGERLREKTSMIASICFYNIHLKYSLFHVYIPNFTI